MRGEAENASAALPYPPAVPRVKTAVGDVLALAVEPGVVALAWVVAKEPARPGWERERWRVVTCAWCGPRAEVERALADPANLAPLRRVWHDDAPLVERFGGPPPDDAEKVGSVAPRRKVPRALTAEGGWPYVPHYARVAREWRADPAAFVARRKAEAERWKAQRDKTRAAAKVVVIVPKGLAPKRPGAPTLATLARTKWLSKWSNGSERALAKSSRAALVALAEELAEKKPKTQAGVLAAVKRTVRALNRVDATSDRRFVTTHAEDLVEALIDVGMAAGGDERSLEAAIDATRAW